MVCSLGDILAGVAAEHLQGDICNDSCLPERAVTRLHFFAGVCFPLKMRIRVRVVFRLARQKESEMRGENETAIRRAVGCVVRKT